MPAEARSGASVSQALRFILHWCRSRTPGPGLAAAKYVALSAVPSDALRSTTLGAGGWAAAARVAMKMMRTNRRRVRMAHLHGWILDTRGRWNASGTRPA